MNPEPKLGARRRLGELMNRLSSQTSRLVRDEMRLAQKEFVECAKHCRPRCRAVQRGRAGGSVRAGQLERGRDRCTVAGVTGVGGRPDCCRGLFAVAGVAGLVSKKQLGQASPAPEMTVANVKQDIQEVKDARHDR